MWFLKTQAGKRSMRAECSSDTVNEIGALGIWTSSRAEASSESVIERMGASWTTNDQKNWLETKRGGFKKAQLQAVLQKFWLLLFSEWLQKWPEELKTTEPLSEEQQKVLSWHIEARKGKLKSWFYRYQLAGDRRQSNQFVKSITKLIGSSTQGSCRLSVVEFFMQTDEQFRADVDAIKSEPVERKLLLTQRKALAAQTLQSKDLEFQTEIAAKARAVCKRMLRKQLLTLRAIEGLSGMFSELLEAVYQVTGWHASVYVGRSDSCINDEVQVYRVRQSAYSACTLTALAASVPTHPALLGPGLLSMLPPSTPLVSTSPSEDLMQVQCTGLAAAVKLQSISVAASSSINTLSTPDLPTSTLPASTSAPSGFTSSFNSDHTQDNADHPLDDSDYPLNEFGLPPLPPHSNADNTDPAGMSPISTWNYHFSHGEIPFSGCPPSFIMASPTVLQFRLPWRAHKDIFMTPASPNSSAGHNIFGVPPQASATVTTAPTTQQGGFEAKHFVQPAPLWAQPGTSVAVPPAFTTPCPVTSNPCSISDAPTPPAVANGKPSTPAAPTPNL
ncbi:hypothetical protein HYDPIDRAFT_169339 [Hydnomerulius pinastri MD-312]|uniref:Uncharacterized protein n=1 Tax=Hydnomerulius pinastri MD-312 TaxID=994086 RepID=A0A0C9WCV2_9AGAM|nr:hypothetical protein HYDPIDRAFT_169339 [Hydnomerulius pinastri MD-312]